MDKSPAVLERADGGVKGDGAKHREVAGLAIEGWSPEYGAPVEAEPDEVPAAEVDPEVEVPGEEWRPIAPHPDGWTPAHLDFVDGVRRIEARVWITGADGDVRPGVFASYAAGLVRCARRAEIRSIRTERGFFGLAGIADLETPVGTFRPRPVADDDIAQLVGGVQEQMRQLEASVVANAGADGTPSGPEPASEAGLVIMDGPLRGGQRTRDAVGYVKSHRVQYLSGDARALVGRLGPGERTPLFLIQTRWTRYSWYLRLTEARGHPWAGIVRCESWPDGGVARAKAVADATAVVLPRFASEPHKDDRAPQNLYPIAGLERELGRRLGDRGIVLRGLQRTVAGYPG